MANLRSRSFGVIGQLWVLCIILGQRSVVLGVGDEAKGGVGDNGREQFCSIELATFLPPPYGNLSYSGCRPVWDTFVLRYYQSKENTLTIVLSAMYTAGWVGIGFSKDGMMVGGSAMVGWISKTGHARIKRYYLKGRTPSEVKPGKGDLNLTNIPPVVVLNGANIYLAFQLGVEGNLDRQPTLLAYGSRYPVNHKLAMHDDKTTIMIDYSPVPPVASEPGNFDKMKKRHGILGILGWGLFLPCGAMVARFLKKKEPLWFYLHTFIQFVGFLTALAGLVIGQALYNQTHAHVSSHRGIGYFALTLSVLQILAFFIRPDKETKIRRVWATYHRWFGVITLFFGALNIVLGIQIGGVGTEWKIFYGLLLGTSIVIAVVLQVFSMLRSSEKPSQPSSFQMN